MVPCLEVKLFERGGLSWRAQLLPAESHRRGLECRQ